MRRYRAQRRARWSECDPAGVVYTVNFCEYVASAFELFMAELLGGPLQTMKQRHGLATPARALTLEFTGPLRPDEEFVMTVAVADAQAQLASAHLKVPAQQAAYRQRKAEEYAARDMLAYQQREFVRQTKLQADGISSLAQLDQAKSNLQSAQQRLAAADNLVEQRKQVRHHR